MAHSEMYRDKRTGELIFVVYIGQGQSIAFEGRGGTSRFYAGDVMFFKPADGQGPAIMGCMAGEDLAEQYELVPSQSPPQSREARTIDLSIEIPDAGLPQSGADRDRAAATGGQPHP